MGNIFAIYTRVSTDEQARVGMGRTGQLANGRDYAARLSFDVRYELNDDISGTTPLYERPAGRKLGELIANKSINGLIVDQIDRIGRDRFGVNFVKLCEDCFNSGVELHLPHSGKLDLSNPFGTVAQMIDGRGAADYLDKMVRRSSQGRRDKAKGGRWVGSGSVPYGYRPNTNHNRYEKLILSVSLPIERRKQRNHDI